MVRLPRQVLPPGKTHGTIAATRGTYRPAEITLRFYNRSGGAGFWRTSVTR